MDESKSISLVLLILTFLTSGTILSDVSGFIDVVFEQYVDG